MQDNARNYSFHRRVKWFQKKSTKCGLIKLNATQLKYDPFLGAAHPNICSIGI
jgi:hypothetical protein